MRFRMTNNERFPLGDFVEMSNMPVNDDGEYSILIFDSTEDMKLFSGYISFDGTWKIVEHLNKPDPAFFEGEEASALIHENITKGDTGFALYDADGIIHKTYHTYPVGSFMDWVHSEGGTENLLSYMEDKLKDIKDGSIIEKMAEKTSLKDKISVYLDETRTFHKFIIPYINGHTNRYEKFKTVANNREEAISRLYEKKGDFDPRIDKEGVKMDSEPYALYPLYDKKETIDGLRDASGSINWESSETDKDVSFVYLEYGKNLIDEDLDEFIYEITAEIGKDGRCAIDKIYRVYEDDRIDVLLHFTDAQKREIEEYITDSVLEDIKKHKEEEKYSDNVYHMHVDIYKSDIVRMGLMEEFSECKTRITKEDFLNDIINSALTVYGQCKDMGLLTDDLYELDENKIKTGIKENERV